MRSKNRIEIRECVGREPETGKTAGGTSFDRLSLATTDRWKGKDDQLHERTEWHRIVFFGPRAQRSADFLHKGSFVEIEGSSRTRSSEKDGQTVFITEVRGTDYTRLDRRSGSEDDVPTAGEPLLTVETADDELPT